MERVKKKKKMGRKQGDASIEVIKRGKKDKRKGV